MAEQLKAKAVRPVPHGDLIKSLDDPYVITKAGILEPPRGWLASLKYLGPGLITSASIVGSGELIATTTLGAKAGFALMWMVFFSCFVKVAVQAEFARWDRDARQPDEFVQSLRELGLFGLIIPEEFGGLGLSNAAYARVLAQTSSYDSSVSLTIGAHSSIGMKGLLLFGTAEQKARYRKIEHEMNVTIAKQRDKWIEAFLERIQTRGYNVHFNILRKIRPEEIPKRPKRKFKVVY